MSELTTKTRPGGDLKALISSDKMRRQFAMALPKHCTPERFCRVALTALTRTPKLAQCTQQSVMKCLLDLSSLGLEPDGRRAHLIPYGQECTLVIDYKGLLELVKRSGEVAVMHCDIVCERDQFERGVDMERGPYIKWTPANGDRGECIGAFSMVKMKEGGGEWEYMTREQIESVRSRSRAAKSGPWVTDWEEMARKTVFRRHSKRLPISSEEVREAIQIDDAHQFEAAIDIDAVEEPPQKPAPKKAASKKPESNGDDSSIWDRVNDEMVRLSMDVPAVERIAVAEGIANDDERLPLYTQSQMEGLLEVLQSEEAAA